MPLVMMCGQPCSGKSTVARALMAALEQRGVAGVLVDDVILPVSIAQAFAGDCPPLPLPPVRSPRRAESAGPPGCSTCIVMADNEEEPLRSTMRRRLLRRRDSCAAGSSSAQIALRRGDACTHQRSWPCCGDARRCASRVQTVLRRR